MRSAVSVWSRSDTSSHITRYSKIYIYIFLFQSTCILFLLCSWIEICVHCRCPIRLLKTSYINGTAFTLASTFCEYLIICIVYCWRPIHYPTRRSRSWRSWDVLWTNVKQEEWLLSTGQVVAAIVVIMSYFITYLFNINTIFVNCLSFAFSNITSRPHRNGRVK